MIVNKKLRLLNHLKSILLLLTVNDKGTDYEINTKDFIKWLKEFDLYFKDQFKIDKGEYMYSLYNRSISISGDEIFTLQEKLKLILKESIKLGYGISITAKIEEIYQNFDFFKELCLHNLVSSITIIIDDNINELNSNLIISEFIDKIMNLKKSTYIAASIKTLKESEILKSPIINRSDITFLPSIQESRSTPPTNPKNSCAEHFHLHINYDGFIYPCMGLVGLENFSLGHIKEPIDKIKINKKEYPLDLVDLMIDGPELSPLKIDKRVSSLPWICEQHQMELLYGKDK